MGGSGPTGSIWTQSALTLFPVHLPPDFLSSALCSQLQPRWGDAAKEHRFISDLGAHHWPCPFLQDPGHEEGARPQRGLDAASRASHSGRFTSGPSMDHRGPALSLNVTTLGLGIKRQMTTCQPGKAPWPRCPAYQDHHQEPWLGSVGQLTGMWAFSLYSWRRQGSDLRATVTVSASLQRPEVSPIMFQTQGSNPLEVHGSKEAGQVHLS